MVEPPSLPPTTEAVPPPPTSPAEVVLEGYLLKQGSRSRQFWHERYFSFDADHTLKYYSQKDDATPKGVFVIPRLADFEVSELFVQQHQKELIYCIKLTWSVDAGDSASASAAIEADAKEILDDVSSVGVFSRCETISPSTSMDQGASPTRSLTGRKQHAASDRSRSSSKTITPFRRLRRRNTDRTPEPSRRRKKLNNVFRSSNRSVDRDSLSAASGARRRRFVRHQSDSLESENVGVPSLVEVDPWLSSSLANPQNGEAAAMKTPPRSNRARTAYEEQREEEQEYLRSQFLAIQKRNRKKAKQKFVQGSKIAMAAGAAIGVSIVTAGIGLVAGLVVLGIGAAAGGGSAAVEATWKNKRTGEIVIASADYETVQMWKACLDASKESNILKKSTWGQLFVSDGRKTDALLPRLLECKQNEIPDRDDEPNRSAMLEKSTSWLPLEGGWAYMLGSGAQGLRIFREEEDSPNPEVRNTPFRYMRRLFTKVSVDGLPSKPMKAHMVLDTSSSDAFLCLMSNGRMTEASEMTLSPNSGQRSSFRIVQHIDDHTDIIHLVFRPLFLFPSWTLPRDFVLFRYWRLDQDKSYVICYKSMQHSDCPPSQDHVRGEMDLVITIAPPKKSYRRRTGAAMSAPQECFMTAVAQVDPKGWVPITPLPFLSNQGYCDAFTVSALSQMLDIRDAIDEDRFIPVSLDVTEQEVRDRSYKKQRLPLELSRAPSTDSAEVDEIMQDDFRHYDYAYAGHESTHRLVSTSEIDLALHPSPLSTDRWAEPDPNSFRVRSEDYKTNKLKINAGPSIGRLVAVDIVTVDEPIYSGFTVHPSERVQLALKKEEALKNRGLKSDMPPFIFVVNIVLPGPPFYHGVFYYAVDAMSSIDGSDGTPSSKLCKKFFFGESDEFRDRTFKLIPQIVHGNFIVRKAVGSTPAIMGKKLRQLYVKSDRFFEVILDCVSSQVATGVIRLTLSYTKNLVVDMGFLFEGNDETTLPERIFGCARMKRINFHPDVVRKVERPPEH